jgi:superoxide dismutase, Fe-Mn family
MAAYTLGDLPYAYDALAPFISEETMTLHHDRHHAAYVKAANETIERLAHAEPWQVAGLERALAFNVSGHGLHTLFWESMSPEASQKPSGLLADAIDTSFGSLENFHARFKAALTTLQGSGWALLVFEPLSAQLQIVQVANHDGSVLVGAAPILAADGWEHAYYVDYRNDRVTWAETFTHVTDWAGAARRYEHVLATRA